MRKLPIYFLIDVSESMVGEQIQYVEDGIATIIKALKSDPHAIETVWISIIIFAGQSKTIIPLQEIVNFYPPKFSIGGGTSLSKGLGQLMFELRKNTIKNTYEIKGDWKPIIFLFTDGVPTDNSSQAIKEWKENWQKSTNLVAISFGDETDVSILKDLTDNILEFKNTTAEDYKTFFKWITDSIKTSSESVENNSSGFELSKIDGDIITKIDLSKPIISPKNIDSNFVVLMGKCQNTKRPYLIKYKKVISSSFYGGMEINSRSYKLVGGFQVDSTYYELSDSNSSNSKVNSSELIGAPSCPCCGNQFSFALCSCGNIHCVGDQEMNTCPSCGITGHYGYGNDSFDVNRTQG